MTLLHAHIENFGKLSSLDVDFNQNLNTFIHENGWGKTTFSAFIKAMFYGMEHSTSKDLAKNEKAKYLPWQGGQYGGSLSFLHDGKEYLITRFFSTKKNEDTFELRDLKTNKISLDYSSNLGNELFGINRETYERSAFISLEQSPEGSNDISAKLNNLIEAGDVANFDKAYELLDKKATNLKAKKGNNDELSSIQNKIDSDRNYIEEINLKLLQNKEYESKIAQIKEDVQGLIQDRDSYTDEIAQIAKYENKNAYEQLKNEEEKLKENKEELLDFFNNKVPDAEQLKDIDSILTEYTTVFNNIKNQSITQTEKDEYEALNSYFAGDIPSKEQIDECLKTDSQYKTFTQEKILKQLTDEEEKSLLKLSKLYEKSDISKEKILLFISQIDLIQAKKNSLLELKTSLQSKNSELSLKKETMKKNKKRIIFIFLALIFAALSSFAFIFKILPAYLCGSLVSVIFIVLSIKSKPKYSDLDNLINKIDKLNQDTDALQKEIEEIEGNLKQFVLRYAPNNNSDITALTIINEQFTEYSRLNQKKNEYESWLNEQVKKTDDYERELKAFVNRFCKTQDITSLVSTIQSLNEKLSKFETLKRKINYDSSNAQNKEEYSAKLNFILGEYKTDKTKDYSLQVQTIHDKLTELNKLNSLIEEQNKKINSFETDPKNDVSSFSSIKKPLRSVSQVQELLNAVLDEINNKNALISGYQKKINDNLSDTEKKEDIETELEFLFTKKQEKTEEHKLLLKTIELLSKAKEKIDSNYSDPMKKGFDKYIKLLGAKLNLVINTDLQVSVDSSGILHKSDFLSEGYKDIVNFCSRMALIDALFDDTKPPIILDDPFVNLDDDKMQKALELIKDIAKEQQLLYFACHKSRSA